MSIATDATSQPLVTSLFDWETGYIVPAILSNPEMAVVVDLVTAKNAEPSVARLDDEETAESMAEYQAWSTQYFKTLFKEAPAYKEPILAGEDARHVWFTLKKWWRFGGTFWQLGGLGRETNEGAFR